MDNGEVHLLTTTTPTGNTYRNDSDSCVDIEVTHQEESLEFKTYEDLHTGDYIIANFPVDKRVRYYIGKIEYD